MKCLSNICLRHSVENSTELIPSEFLNLPFFGDFMKLNKFVILGLTTLALAAPFGAHAAKGGEPLPDFNMKMYMKMADKDGMLSKADVMKMVEEKFDAVAKGGMISVKDFGALIADMNRGHGGNK
jgi:hypothetical protein